jgi:hypothetical protein
MQRLKKKLHRQAKPAIANFTVNSGGTYYPEVAMINPQSSGFKWDRY